MDDAFAELKGIRGEGAAPTGTYVLVMAVCGIAPISDTRASGLLRTQINKRASR